MLDVVTAREDEFAVVAVDDVLGAGGVVVRPDGRPRGQQLVAVFAESVLQLVFVVVCIVHDLAALLAPNL